MRLAMSEVVLRSEPGARILCLCVSVCVGCERCLTKRRVLGCQALVAD